MQDFIYLAWVHAAEQNPIKISFEKYTIYQAETVVLESLEPFLF